MGNRLIWGEQYNIGVEIIDREHKKLFSILNKLFDFGHKEGKGHFACQEAIKYFKDHAIQHFADEKWWQYEAGLEKTTDKRFVFFTYHGWSNGSTFDFAVCKK